MAKQGEYPENEKVRLPRVSKTMQCFVFEQYNVPLKKDDLFELNMKLA